MFLKLSLIHKGLSIPFRAKRGVEERVSYSGGLGQESLFGEE